MTDEQNMNENTENQEPIAKPKKKWGWGKRIVVFGGGLIVLVIVVGLLMIEPIAKRSIEIGTEMALGVPTTLDDVEISILRGQYQLNGLRIENPEGFDLVTFVSLNNVSVNVVPSSLLKKDIIVPTVEVHGLHMNLEKKDKRENYKVIMENLHEFTGKQKTDKKEPEKKEPEKEGIKFTVENIVLRDVTVKTKGLMPGDKGKDAPPLHFDEIALKETGTDSNEGMIAAQFMDKILVAVLAASAEHGVTAVSGAIGEGLGGAADITTEAGTTVIEGVGGLFGGDKKQKKQEVPATQKNTAEVETPED